MTNPADLSVDETVALLSESAILIDVRETAEWDAGHAPMAQHIALFELPDRLGDLPTDRPVLCICRTGARSGRAAAFLRESGLDAHNVAGGMVEWVAQGHPLAAEDGEPEVL